MTFEVQYKESIAGYSAGFIPNSEPNVLISRTVEDATPIAFGKAVAQGTGDNGITLLTTGATDYVGITCTEHSTDANTPDVFAQYDNARVMTKGVICVEVSETVSAGDAVHVVLSTSAFSNNGGQTIPNARYDSSGVSGDIVKVRLG